MHNSPQDGEWFLAETALTEENGCYYKMCASVFIYLCNVFSTNKGNINVSV